METTANLARQTLTRAELLGPNAGLNQTKIKALSAIAHPDLNTILAHFRALPIVEVAFETLKADNPKDLCYHTLDHTQNVFEKAIRLAHYDGVSLELIELIAIAAAWHDLGYTQRYENNEPCGAKLARQAMQRFHYAEDAINLVETAILDTALKPTADGKCIEQRSNCVISPYLLDADLSNFGSLNFFRQSFLVLQEQSKLRVTSPADLRDDRVRTFMAGTIKLLSYHRWKSTAAQTLFEPTKQRNLRHLARLLTCACGASQESLNEAWTEAFAQSD